MLPEPQFYVPKDRIDYQTLQRKPAVRDSSGFWRRRRLNWLAIALALLVPILLFSGVLYLLTSRFFHYSNSLWCWVLVALAAGVVAFLGWLAYKAYRNGEEPMWYLFIFATSLLAYVAAIMLAEHIYGEYLHEYNELRTLQVYSGVDPATVGSTYMDAGIIEFTSDAVIDRSHAMAFRSDHNYCVAPVSLSSSPLAVYDYWMVGVDCCSSASAGVNEFGCQTRAMSPMTVSGNTATALNGKRLMVDGLRQKFRLAVDQAESHYGIHSEHPIFLKWTDQAVTELENQRRDGVTWVIGSIVGFAAFHALLVAICTFLYGKLIIYPATLYW